MATEPTSLPEWDSNGTANTAEPTSDFKANGWPEDSEVISSYFNYWMSLVYAWVAWLAKGSWELHIHAFSAVYNGTDWSRNTAGYIVNSTSIEKVYFPIDLRNGDRITGIGVNRRGTGSADFTYKLFRMDGAGGQTPVDNDTETSVAATWGTKALAFTTTAVDDGQTHFLEITVNGNGSRIESIIVTVDRAP
jgi:hypothetical protein